MIQERIKRFVTCGECGVTEELHWHEDVEKRLLARPACFNCDFWLGYVETKNDSTHVRIDNTHYVIGEEPSSLKNKSWLGHGGREFIIKFFVDAKTVVTHNLWFQGIIPERFRDRLPNNAEFIQEKDLLREAS